MLSETGEVPGDEAVSGPGESGRQRGRPLEELIMPLSRQKAVGVAAADRGPLRVLVADDNAVVKAAIRGLLGGLGHRVETVADGLAAIEAAEGAEFDLILLDLQMPEVGGIEAAAAIRKGRQAGRRPRIVGMSAERIGREASRASGMDDFLIKPVRVAELIRACEDAAAAADDFGSYAWGVCRPSEGELRTITDFR